MSAAPPDLRFERLDTSQPAPSVLAELDAKTENGRLGLGRVLLNTSTERIAFRIRVADWKGFSGLRDVRLFLVNTEMPRDAFLVGFTDVWSEVPNVALHEADRNPPGEAAPASWNLSSPATTSGFCVLSFRKGPAEYPARSYGADGAGTLRAVLTAEAVS